MIMEIRMIIADESSTVNVKDESHSIYTTSLVEFTSPICNITGLIKHIKG